MHAVYFLYIRNHLFSSIRTHFIHSGYCTDTIFIIYVTMKMIILNIINYQLVLGHFFHISDGVSMDLSNFMTYPSGTHIVKSQNCLVSA